MVMLFMILLLVLLIPSVQPSLGAYATKKINSKYGTDMRVEKLGLQLNGDLELKNILIKDHHNDTLIAVTELNSSILNFAKLNDNKLLFGDIDLYGLRFHIKTYTGEKDSNLDIFVESFDRRIGPPRRARFWRFIVLALLAYSAPQIFILLGQIARCIFIWCSKKS